MTRASRPCFTDLEISFMLHVLKEAAAVKKQQAEALEAEKQRLINNVQSLSLRLFKEGPYNTCRELKEDRDKLAALGGGLATSRLEKENIVLNGIISHLQKIQRHQRGHVKHLHSLFWSYLEDLSALETQKATVSR